MKGIILCAGKGTRLRPFSYTLPKVLVKIANKPVLHYCIEKMTALGITEIGLVIHPSQQNSIEQYIGTGETSGIQVTYILQKKQLGIAHALKQAKSFIGKESFLLLLGDNLIEESLEKLIESVKNKTSNSSILLGRVDTPKDYGIVEISDNNIISIEEKPKEPKTNLAVLGAYAFDWHIFNAIDHISPSSRGEYEITDALKWLIQHNYKISFFETSGFHSDVGTIPRLLDANQSLLRNPNVGKIGKGTIEQCIIIPPVSIEENCHLSHSIIGPNVSIAAGTYISHCHIENSIVYEESKLSSVPYKIKNSIIGKQSCIEGSRQELEKDMDLTVGENTSIAFRTKGEESNL